MKKIVLALALIPAVGFASQSQQSFAPSPTHVTDTYVCQKYTDNEMSPGVGFVTDNPVVQLEFKIEQTEFDYVVKPNMLFPDPMTMTVPEGGEISGLSGNKHDMMFKNEDGDGKPYFIIYMSNTDPKSKGEINRAVVIAGCDQQ